MSKKLYLYARPESSTHCLYNGADLTSIVKDDYLIDQVRTKLLQYGNLGKPFPAVILFSPKFNSDGKLEKIKGYRVLDRSLISEDIIANLNSVL